MTDDEADAVLLKIVEGDPLTQAETAAAIGITRMGVYFAERRALQKVRGALGYLGRPELRDALQAWTRARDARA
jgi:predicted DNA-binding protein (UPF0251 family)